MSRVDPPSRTDVGRLGRTRVSSGRGFAPYAVLAPAAMFVAIATWAAHTPAVEPTVPPPTSMGLGTEVGLQGGIPITIDGAQVWWGMGARSELLGMTTDAAVLIGVSVSTNATTTCAAQRGEPQTTQGEIRPDDYVEVEPALLTRAGCGPYTTTGAPGSILFPPPVDAEWRHDGPAVLRVHVNDARAKDCPEDQLDACAAAIVVDDVIWTGGEPELGPHGLSIQLARALSADVTLPDGSTTVVAPNVFAVPSQCTTGNDIVYRLYGDSRLTLAVLGRDGAEPSLPSPVEAGGCMEDVRSGGHGEWISLGSAFVLSYGGEVFDERLRAAYGRNLDDSSLKPIPPAEDESAAMHELQAYLKARESGIVASAWGTRLVVATDEEDEANGAYIAWLDDAVSRADADALSGSVEPAGQAEALDGTVLELLARHGAEDARLFRVFHARSTSADLAEEFYVVFRRGLGVPSTYGVMRVSS